MTPKLRVPPPSDRSKLAIIAVDPGPGCGIAVYHPYPAVPGHNFDTQTLNLESDGHGWLYKHLSETIHDLKFFLKDNGPDQEVSATAGVVLICEKFEYRKDDARERERINFMAAEYVGVCKLLAQEYERRLLLAQDIVMQGASEAKGFWTNFKLAQLGLHGGSRHEMDALRHLLKFMTFNLHQQWLLKMLKEA